MSPLFWLSYVIRSLRRSGRRAVFASVGVAVGVAGVVAIQIASLTVQDALTTNVRAANGGDISLVSQEAPLSRSDLTVFRRLQSSGRIAAWTATYTLRATTVDAKHELVPFDVNVVSTPPYPLGGQPTFVSPATGNVDALLAYPRGVLVTDVLAQELGVRVGSSIRLNTIGGRGLSVVVRGVLAQTTFAHAATMMLSRRDAGALSNGPPQYTSVFINLSSTPQVVAATLRTDFPAANVQTVSEALQADEAQIHDFHQFTLLVGLLALLIAGVGTLNAMQSMLVRRRLEIAMLKAMGFRQETLYGLFGGEALLIGLAGGLLGTAGGAAGSKLVTDALAQVLALQVTFVVDAGTLVSGVALGVGAALVFAVLPIARAAAFRPLELLREGATDMVFSQWRQTLGLLSVIVVLFAILASVILTDVRLGMELTLAALAVCAILMAAFSVIIEWLSRVGPPESAVTGAVVLVALIAITAVATVSEPPIAPILVLSTALWAAMLLLPRSRLLPLLIATRALGRHQTRTSATLVAFLIGILAMALTLTVALGLRSQIDNTLAATRSTNLVAATDLRSKDAVLRASGSLPGVESRIEVTIVQTTPIAINGRSLPSLFGPKPGVLNRAISRLRGVTGYDLTRGISPTRVTIDTPITIAQGRALETGDAGTNHVLVRSEMLDPPYSLRVGDRITLREAAGTSQTVRVVGFYSRKRRARGLGLFSPPPLLGDQSLVASLGGADAQSLVGFTIRPDQLAHDAITLQGAVPGALVTDIGDLAVMVDQILNDLLNLLAVITVLVLGAGMVVVANSVALAMLERRREIALFKAVGFGPGNVLRFVLVENALIGLLAGAVGVLTTAIGLSVLSHIALKQAIGFDPGVAVLVLAIATALAVTVAYLMARGPVRLRPLEALRNE